VGKKARRLTSYAPYSWCKRLASDQSVIGCKIQNTRHPRARGEPDFKLVATKCLVPVIPAHAGNQTSNKHDSPKSGFPRARE